MVVQGACRTAPNSSSIASIVNNTTATSTAAKGIEIGVDIPIDIDIDIEGSSSSTSTPSRPSQHHPPPATTTTTTNQVPVQVQVQVPAAQSDISHTSNTSNISTTTTTTTTSAGVPCATAKKSSTQGLYESIDEVPNEILADTIALILEQFISRSTHHHINHNNNTQYALPKANEPAALFFSPSKQTDFSLSFYIRRLVQYTCCSKSAFVVAVLYLARLSQNHPVFILNELNVHRLICTSIVLAAKWLDDISYSNSHYARVSGVQTAAEMTRMENYFLKAIDFRLYVAPQNYRDVENSLLNIAASWS